jgi:hypothetical protein
MIEGRALCPPQAWVKKGARYSSNEITRDAKYRDAC